MKRVKLISSLTSYIFHPGAGFTLLELTIVFSVMAILAGIGFASFVSYNKKQVVDQAAYDMKTGIDQARFDAVSRVKPADPLYAASCGAGGLDRYRFKTCTTVADATHFTVTCSTGSNNLYEIDPVCINGGVDSSPLQDKPMSFKKRPANLKVSISSGECGLNGVIRFYTLGGVTDISSCRIVLSTNDPVSPYSKTICIDSAGNASIKTGSVSCP